jgi:cytochrome c553
MRITVWLIWFACASMIGTAWPQSSESRAARDSEFREGAALQPNLRHGAELFDTCAACHGADGRGTDDGEIPAIAGQHGSVLLKQLTDFRHDQRWNERMRNFTDRHHLADAQDLTDVAAYVAQLSRFPITHKGIGDGADLRAGASVYFQRCERCHGPLGQGDLLRIRPRLAGQHFAYLFHQLEETAAGQRPGMDQQHVDMLNRLSTPELRGVADYLSRLSPELNSTRRP